LAVFLCFIFFKSIFIWLLLVFIFFFLGFGVVFYVFGFIFWLVFVLLERLKEYFVAGVVAVIPLAVTVFVFWWILSWLDGLMSPTLEVFLGDYVVGLSLVLTLFFILAVGLIIREFVGFQVLYHLEGELSGFRLYLSCMVV